MEIAALVCNKKMDYDAVFKTYSLYEYLRKIGNVVEVIDYNFLRRKSDKKNKMLYEFLNNNIIMTVNRYNSVEQIEQCLPLADKFIVANGDYNDLKIRFNSNNVLAYGINNININELNNIADRYSKISFSSNNSQLDGMIKVIDPVFLLSKNEWEDIVDINSNIEINTKYVLVYASIANKQMLNYASKMMENSNKKLYIVADKIEKLFFKAKRLKNVTPFNLLGLIQNAEAVITNLNDGIKFSAILDKKVHIFTDNSSEQIGIINSLALRNRVVLNSNHLLPIEDEYINNNYYDLYIDELRRTSQEFLK